MSKKNVSTLKQRTIPDRLKLFLFAIPFLIFITAFSYVPLFGWIYAFVDYKPWIPLFNSPFVGLSKFVELFKSGSDFINAITNTFIFSFIGIICTPLAAIFALLLNELRSPKFKRLVQTLTTIPNFISWIVLFSLSFAMFSSNGMVINLLIKLGILSTQTNLLGNNNAVWIFQSCLGIWKSLGWGSILYLAAISSIDCELYDAAKIDGANSFARAIHVTIPGMISTFFVLLLLAISNILNNGFDQYFVFYNPLVAQHITVLDLYTYQAAFLTNDYSLSTAIGMFKTLVSVTLLFGANHLSKLLRGETII